MTVRAMRQVILCSVVLGTTVGCSSQPIAPSGTGSVSGSPATSTAVSTSRLGDRTIGTVFVTSQGLYYDTFVVTDPLPMKGKFQLIADGQTEFGPGQPGYLGGRWWEDTNGNGIQDPEDHYFLCPLLPPGRSMP